MDSSRATTSIGSHHHLSGYRLCIQVLSPKRLSATRTAAAILDTPAYNNVQQYSGDWTWTPNSTLVNDFRLGYVFIQESDVSTAT